MVGCCKMRYFIFIICLAFFSGCATVTVRVPHPELMTETNPVQGVGIVGIANVLWPGEGTEENNVAFGPVEAEQGLISVLEMTRNTLIEKRYDVLAAYPLATGTGMSAKQTIYDSVTDEKWIWSESEIYKIFEDVPDKWPEEVVDIIDRSTKEHNFDTASISEICDVLKCDTIGIIDLRGTCYSASRKAGSMAADIGVGILTGCLTGGMVVATPGLTVSDSCAVRATFIDSSGRILWQNASNAGGSPSKVSESTISSLLKYFPTRGEPMDPNHIRKEPSQ